MIEKHHTHEMMVRVVFNKKCTEQDAVRAVKQTILGQSHYPSVFDERNPDIFIFRAVKRI